MSVEFVTDQSPMGGGWVVYKVEYFSSSLTERSIVGVYVTEDSADIVAEFLQMMREHYGVSG